KRIVSHDDNSASVVESMHELGTVLSEFPLNEEACEMAKTLGMNTTVGAPNIVMRRSHTGSASALELVRGFGSLVCSDYHPPSLLWAVFALANESVASLPEAVWLASGGPAAVLALRDRGQIAVGMRADLIVVDPDSLSVRQVYV